MQQRIATYSKVQQSVATYSKSRLVIEDQKVILEDNNPEHNNDGAGDKFTPRVS